MVTAQQKTDPILVRLWPLEETRTPNKGCVYVAACEMGGVPYSARSRSGSATELARVLVARLFFFCRDLLPPFGPLGCTRYAPT